MGIVLDGFLSVAHGAASIEGRGKLAALVTQSVVRSSAPSLVGVLGFGFKDGVCDRCELERA